MIPDFSEQGHLVYKVVKIKKKEMEIFCKIAEVSWGVQWGHVGDCARGIQPC